MLRKGFDPTDGGSLFFTLKDSVLRLYTLGHFRRVTKRELTPGVLPEELRKQYTYLVVSLGAEVEVDSQGRVVLPENVLGRSGLGKQPNTAREVTLVGADDHIQLFPRDQWKGIDTTVTAARSIIETSVTQILGSTKRDNSASQPKPAN